MKLLTRLKTKLVPVTDEDLTNKKYVDAKFDAAFQYGSNFKTAISDAITAKDPNVAINDPVKATKQDFINAINDMQIGEDIQPIIPNSIQSFELINACDTLGKGRCTFTYTPPDSISFDGITIIAKVHAVDYAYDLLECCLKGDELIRFENITTPFVVSDKESIELHSNLEYKIWNIYILYEDLEDNSVDKTVVIRQEFDNPSILDCILNMANFTSNGSINIKDIYAMPYNKYSRIDYNKIYNDDNMFPNSLDDGIEVYTGKPEANTFHIYCSDKIELPENNTTSTKTLSTSHYAMLYYPNLNDRKIIAFTVFPYTSLNGIKYYNLEVNRNNISYTTNDDAIADNYCKMYHKRQMQVFFIGSMEWDTSKIFLNNEDKIDVFLVGGGGAGGNGSYL